MSINAVSGSVTMSMGASAARPVQPSQNSTQMAFAIAGQKEMMQIEKMGLSVIEKSLQKMSDVSQAVDVMV